MELSKCLGQWRGEQTKSSPTLLVNHSKNISSTHVLELWSQSVAAFYPLMGRVEANKSVFQAYPKSIKSSWKSTFTSEKPNICGLISGYHYLLKHFSFPYGFRNKWQVQTKNKFNHY